MKVSSTPRRQRRAPRARPSPRTRSRCREPDRARDVSPGSGDSTGSAASAPRSHGGRSAGRPPRPPIVVNGLAVEPERDPLDRREPRQRRDDLRDAAVQRRGTRRPRRTPPRGRPSRPLGDGEVEERRRLGDRGRELVARSSASGRRTGPRRPPALLRAWPRPISAPGRRARRGGGRSRRTSSPGVVCASCRSSARSGGGAASSPSHPAAASARSARPTARTTPASAFTRASCRRIVRKSGCRLTCERRQRAAHDGRELEPVAGARRADHDTPVTLEHEGLVGSVRVQARLGPDGVAEALEARRAHVATHSATAGSGVGSSSGSATGPEW